MLEVGINDLTFLCTLIICNMCFEKWFMASNELSRFHSKCNKSSCTSSAISVRTFIQFHVYVHIWIKNVFLHAWRYAKVHQCGSHILLLNSIMLLIRQFLSSYCIIFYGRVIFLRKFSLPFRFVGVFYFFYTIQ